MVPASLPIFYVNFWQQQPPADRTLHFFQQYELVGRATRRVFRQRRQWCFLAIPHLRHHIICMSTEVIEDTFHSGLVVYTFKIVFADFGDIWSGSTEIRRVKQFPVMGSELPDWHFFMICTQILTGMVWFLRYERFVIFVAHSLRT